MKFFNPTHKFKELLLLHHIEENPNTTQKEIANVIDAAPSMVNVYIDNLEVMNYLKRDYKTSKTIYYNITEDGIKRKNYLSFSYFYELLELYSLAEESIENFILRFEEKGYKKVLVYAAGEAAETILGVIKSRVGKQIKILALVDDDERLHNKELLGYKIISRDEIKDYDHDGIIITSYAFENDISNRLKEVGYPEDRIERFFTK